MPPAQIDSILNARHRRRLAAMRMMAADKKTVSYPREKLDKKSKDLELLLAALLLDLAAGRIARAEARKAGLIIIAETFKVLTAEIAAFYRGAGLGGSSSEEALDKARTRAISEFTKALEEPAEENKYWATPVGRRRVSELLALLIVYGIAAAMASSMAKAATGVSLRWVTAGDDKVCLVCRALEGDYRLDEELPEMPQHLGCRCTWVLVIRV